MLGKLIKNEFNATVRTFGAMYLIVFIVTVALKLFVEIQETFNLDNMVINIVAGITTIAFILGIVGVIIGTFILILKRFYDSMLKSEGYLTFTLPATVGQHIASKAIVSYVWIIASVAFIFAIIMILFLGHLSPFAEMRKDLLDMIDLVNQHHLWKYVFEVIVVIAIGAYNYMAIGYACFSIGQAWTKNKIAGAFATYVIFNIITQIIGTIVLVVLFGNINTVDNVNMGDDYFQPLMIYSIVEQTIVAIICTMATRFMLSRKLNLE